MNIRNRLRRPIRQSWFWSILAVLVLSAVLFDRYREWLAYGLGVLFIVVLLGLILYRPERAAHSEAAERLNRAR